MANTVNDIEDLLIEKILALTDGTGAHRFAAVENMSSAEFNIEEFTDYPAAVVGFQSEEVSEVNSRLIIKETYEVLVAVKKTGKDTARTPQTLCTAVRDGIHGKDWGEDDIAPFHYLGRERVSTDAGQVIVYSLKFSTTHYLHIPTTT
jgi:hypothetical protein